MISGLLLSMFTLILTINSTQAQSDWKLHVTGKVILDDETSVEKSVVTVRDNHDEVVSINPDNNGNFNIKLSSDNVYVILCSHEGYVSKSLEFNLENISNDYKQGGDGEFRFDISLFRELDGLDASIFNKPMARVEMNEENTMFIFNNEYMKTMRDELDRVMKERDKILKANDAE